MYNNTPTHPRAYTHSQAYMHMHTHTYTHMCAHTHTHTLTHTDCWHHFVEAILVVCPDQLWKVVEGTYLLERLAPETAKQCGASRARNTGRGKYPSQLPLTKQYIYKHTTVR